MSTSKMAKIISILKNYKISIPVLIAIVAVGTTITFAGRDGEIKGEFLAVAKSAISQKIDVTGRIVPAKEVSLSVESGGRVKSVNVEVGQKVQAGQILLGVDSSDLYIRLGRQEAALEKAKLVLTKQEPKTNAADDLALAYEDGFNVVSNAFLDLPAIVLGIDDILGQDYLDPNYIRIIDGRKALDIRDETKEAFRVAEDKYEDVLKTFRLSSRSSNPEEIEKLILETYEATKLLSDTVKKANNFVDYIEDAKDGNVSPELDSDQIILSEYTATTNNHLIELLAIKDAIKDSKEAINDEGYDLTDTKISIKQAELDIKETLYQISKRTLRSPISGVVSQIDAEVGEMISSGDPIVRIISSNEFQVEADLPESDVAKISIGAEAVIELGAYGDDAIFKAKVSSIDPGETLIDGVSTYKTTIQFVETDSRIKSGMTADITIMGDSKENVIAIPQRAVFTREGKKYVQVMVGEEISDREVTTGMRDTDGNIEITSGIEEGENVLVYSEK